MRGRIGLLVETLGGDLRRLHGVGPGAREVVSEVPAGRGAQRRRDQGRLLLFVEPGLPARLKHLLDRLGGVSCGVILLLTNAAVLHPMVRSHHWRRALHGVLRGLRQPDHGRLWLERLEWRLSSVDRGLLL